MKTALLYPAFVISIYSLLADTGEKHSTFTLLYPIIHYTRHHYFAVQWANIQQETPSYPT